MKLKTSISNRSSKNISTVLGQFFKKLMLTRAISKIKILQLLEISTALTFIKFKCR